MELLKEEAEAVETLEPVASRETHRNIWKICLEYGIVIVVGALIAFLLMQFVLINARIPSGSMIPTLNVGDRMIGLRTSLYFSDPDRGDVIIFRNPVEGGETYLVKRVIGLPGEKVHIDKGVVSIEKADGTILSLDESYVAEPADPDNSMNNKVYSLGADEYFMMGDNRNHSSDSRVFGNVSRKALVAEAWFKYYPKFQKVE